MSKLVGALGPGGRSLQMECVGSGPGTECKGWGAARETWGGNLASFDDILCSLGRNVEGMENTRLRQPIASLLS